MVRLVTRFSHMRSVRMMLLRAAAVVVFVMVSYSVRVWDHGLGLDLSVLGGSREA